MNIKILKSLNILYVEDDLIVSGHTVILLESFFHTVYHCDNAEDALELIKNKHVHLMITDIELPGMSGLQLCEEIRKTNLHMPILVISAHSHKEMLKRAIKLYLVDYLIKPFTIKALTKALNESLDQLHKIGDLQFKIDNDRYYYPLLGKVETHGETILLSKSEVQLLDFLITKRNKIVSKTEIEHILNPDEPISDSAFKNIIYRLRKKIGKENIISISGMGIKLKTENE